MGRLTDLYMAASSTILNMKLRQAVYLAGDGNFLHEESYMDFRDYLEHIDIRTMGRFIDEALSENKSEKFLERGYALQDIVNEMGRRLGFKVTNGLYKGTKGDENGLDGLWESVDGTFIVMESKTTDVYSLDIKVVESYRDKLISQGITTREKSSVLIVLGRDDKNTVPGLVRGSKYRDEMRVISTKALFDLLCVYEKSRSDTVSRQITQLLKPHDYTKLDNLVSLVFPSQSDEQRDFPIDCEHVQLQLPVYEANNESETVVIPDLPEEKDIKIGKYVFTAMNNLSESGFTFSEEQVKELCSVEWSHRVLKLGKKYPFAKIYNDGEEKPHYVENYVRYRSKPLAFGNVRLLITKELFDNNGKTREAFKMWYKSLQ